MNKLIHSQSLVDKLATARHTITGQDVAKAVLKTTTDEICSPKRKHLDYLIWSTDNPNISIPDIAKMLLDRAQNPHWAVTFKALMVIHEIMNYGNEIFFQHMASNNFTLTFDFFCDKTDGIALHMSRFVRFYAIYVNSKAVSFRTVGYDFCKVKRGGADSFFRKLEMPNLLDALSRLQRQIDNLLAFDATLSDLINGIINAAFMALFKDLVRLFICYKEGMTNLVDKFFSLEKKQCRDAFAVYKTFVSQAERIAKFFKLAEDSGVDKADIPKKVEISSGLTEAFEKHVKSFDVVKRTISDFVVTLPKPNETSTKRHSSVVERRSVPSITVSVDSNDGEHLLLSDEEKSRIISDEKKRLDLYKQGKSERELKVSSFHPPTNSLVDNLTPESRSRPVSFHYQGTPTSKSVLDEFLQSPMPQTTNLSPPPGFTGSGHILQPIKLHPSPPPSPISPPDSSPFSLNSPTSINFNNSGQFMMPLNNSFQASAAYIVPLSSLNYMNGVGYNSPVLVLPSQGNLVSPYPQRNPFL